MVHFSLNESSFRFQLTAAASEEEDPVPLGDLIGKGDHLRILVRRLFSHKQVRIDISLSSLSLLIVLYNQSIIQNVITTLTITVTRLD